MTTVDGRRPRTPFHGSVSTGAVTVGPDDVVLVDAAGAPAVTVLVPSATRRATSRADRVRTELDPDVVRS